MDDFNKLLLIELSKFHINDLILMSKFYKVDTIYELATKITQIYKKDAKMSASSAPFHGVCQNLLLRDGCVLLVKGIDAFGYIDSTTNEYIAVKRAPESKYKYIKTVRGRGIYKNAQNSADNTEYQFTFGRWGLPKGHRSSATETLQECALRELKEETGISDVKILGTLNVSDSTKVLVSECTTGCNDLVDTSDESEIVNYGWVPFKTLASNKNLYRNVNRSLKDVIDHIRRNKIMVPAGKKCGSGGGGIILGSTSDGSQQFPVYLE